MKPVIDEKTIENANPGDIFARDEGTFSVLDAMPVKWVAIKGFGNDWAIYYERPTLSDEHIKRWGTKVNFISTIKQLADVSDEALKLYRK